MNKDFIPNMYKIVDRMDAQGLADAMTPSGTFRFANMDPVTGTENLAGFFTSFFSSIKGISHTDLEYWFMDNTWFATGTVSYTRHDDSSLTVPFSVILKMQDELIDQYLVFVDASQLYI